MSVAVTDASTYGGEIELSKNLVAGDDEYSAVYDFTGELKYSTGNTAWGYGSSVHNFAYITIGPNFSGSHAAGDYFKIYKADGTTRVYSDDEGAFGAITNIDGKFVQGFKSVESDAKKKATIVLEWCVSGVVTKVKINFDVTVKASA